MNKIELVNTVERKYTPFCLSLNIYNNCLADLKKVAPFTFSVPDKSAHVRDLVFWVKGFVGEVAQYQINNYNIDGARFLWRISSLCENAGKKFLYFVSKINKSDFSKRSNEELIRYLNNVVNGFREFSVFIPIPLSMEKFLDEELDALLKERVKNDEEVKELHKKLIQPFKLNEGQKETLSVYELAYEFKRGLINILNKKNDEILAELKSKHKKLLEKIHSHLERFSWVTIRWMIGEPMNFDDLMERIRTVSDENLERNLKFISEKVKEAEKEMTDISKSLKFSEKEKDFVNIVKEYVYLRTFRTDTLNRANYLIYHLLEEIAARLDISFKDLLYLVSSEVIQFLETGKMPKNVDIKKRKEDWAFFRDGEMLEISQGRQEVDKLIKKYDIPMKSYVQLEEVKGNSAWKGKVLGKAKILMSPEEIGKVAKGDILIAVMTFPSFVPAMEKAAAFVTDEGGILCHAAIVSREMKKPCVIGTKMATKIFRDGDEVEVDADKGIVKIIKRAK